MVRVISLIKKSPARPKIFCRAEGAVGVGSGSILRQQNIKTEKFSFPYLKKIFAARSIKNVENFSVFSPEGRVEPCGGIGSANFCPARRKRAGQSKVSVRIFSKKGSDFIQKRQHTTIFLFFRFVLRLAASRLGVEKGQISETFFALRAKKF